MNNKKKKLRTCLLNNKSNSSNNAKSFLNYKDSIKYNNKSKSINKSFTKRKCIKILKNPLTKSVKEVKSSLFHIDSSSFYESNKSQTNTLTTNDINTLNSIIKKFKKNPSATRLLFNKAKRLELNSLSNMTDKK